MSFLLYRRCGFIFQLVFLLALILCAKARAARADQIRGTVRNLTTDTLSSGDPVLLLRVADHSVSEEARTTTNAQGAFILPMRFPEASYLVRVIRQGVNYDQQASPGDTLSVEVFDAARKVQGISETIEILRAGTQGSLLHVSDMHEVKNESWPPLTLYGGWTFDVYLLPGARLDTVLAAGPGRVAVMISATAVPGAPGHFAVHFPLRPGATKFAFNYDVPYSGHISFHSRHSLSLQQLAVMTPPTMQFSSSSPAFAVLPAQNPKYLVRAANLLAPGQGLSFDLSGAGDLPPITSEAKSQEQAAAFHHPALSEPARPAAPPATPAHSAESLAQSPSQSVLPTAMAVFLLAVCAFLIWQSRK